MKELFTAETLAVYITILAISLIVGTLLVIGMMWLNEKRKNK